MNEFNDPQSLIPGAISSLHNWLLSADAETSLGEPSPHLKIEVDESGNFHLTILNGSDIVAEARDPTLAMAFHFLQKDLPPV